MKKYILVVVLLLAAFLRLWKLDVVPVSLFGDELDVGYHAYSILKTGQDYSGNSWPLHFQSLAEWRTPLYLYSSVPTVALFGITPLGVRLPAAIFGILSIWAFYLLVKQLTQNERLALIGAFILTISPWHIQYSRAGFEVTQLLFFLIFGLCAFLKSFEKPKWLSIAAICFALMPWVYSTAKLFLPLLLTFLGVAFYKNIIRIKRKYLVLSTMCLVLILVPITYSTIFGGGAARFNYISVFTDPTIEPEVGTARQNDALARGERGTGLNPTPVDKLYHNKFLFWFDNIERNYLQSLSTDFFFNEGDLNMRHSIKGIGQFYRIEIIPLILGIILFFTSKINRKHKWLIAFWILVGVIPSVITRDGGTHATRLILILPPLVFLIGYGLVESYKRLPRRLSFLVPSIYGLLLLLSFAYYQHNFWKHNPYQSERWWHAGWKQAIQAVKEQELNYDKVVITSADEPPWIFFAGQYMYDPVKWHQGYPFKKTNLQGFGEVSFIDKYYFASPTDQKGLYDWGKVFDSETLYLASQKEVKVNLLMEPERLPKDLKMLAAIAYPSGEPAFYLFARKEIGQ
jgi:4-amino-4-deoxy-L-arabinose transferase-like glycosyltransferase